MPHRIPDSEARSREARLRDQGFAHLVADSRGILGRYIRRLVRSHSAAEEIVQEAYLRTYEQGLHAEPLRPYLFSVARNLAWKARRHERVVNKVAAKNPTADWPESYASPEDEALADERMRLLNEAIANLPPQCRAVFIRRMFNEQSYKEIASQLGISAKTVEKHIALGVRTVHAALAKRYQEGNSP